MNAPLVQMSSVSKRFGARQILDRLDRQVAPGQVIGLLGRNGAGKSTLLECMLGLREADGTRARNGSVPQKSDLFDWLTPPQMLAYFEAMYPRWNKGKVEGLLSRWGFDPARLRVDPGLAVAHRHWCRRRPADARLAQDAGRAAGLPGRADGLI